MPKIQTFSQANEILAGFIPTDKVRRYTLDRMKQLMAFLGNPQNNLSVIHVAGTSGKTSTSYYLAALLYATGRTVGLSISPHIDSIGERAQINLQSLPESEFCKELSSFLELVEKSAVHPSYFEVLVAFTYWLFDKKGVDYAVIEVGLGGLIDGTNVIDRSDKVCVITDIGFDHTEILGNTLSEIATQKAGIILEKNRVFMHSQPVEVMQTISDICSQRSAQLFVVDEDYSLSTLHQYEALPVFQKRNIGLAYRVVSQVLTSPEDQTALKESLVDSAATHIPARMEEITWHKKRVIMDGSHNEQKIRSLVDAMKNKYKDTPITLVVSFGENKTASLEDNLKLLRSLSSTIIITEFTLGQDEIRRPINPEKIAEVAKERDFETIIIESDPARALEAARGLAEDIILVTGSFYLLNHIRPIVLGKEKRTP